MKRTSPLQPTQNPAGDHWAYGIAFEWADELSDIRQDVYTAADGLLIAG